MDLGNQLCRLPKSISLNLVTIYQKGSFMRNITFVFVTLCVVFGLFLSACSNQLGLWKYIKETDRFYSITISDRYGLFLEDSTNSHKIYHYPDKTIQDLEQYITIDYKEEFRRTRFLEDDFWFVTDSFRVIKYSLLTKTVTEYPQINKLGNVLNFVASNNKDSLVVWGEHWVAIHTLEWTSYVLSNITVQHAIQDDDGKLWVLSDKNEIFYKDGDKWVLWNTFQSKSQARRIWKIGQSIFLTTVHDGIYRWVIGDTKPEQLIKFEPDAQGYIYVSITNIEKDKDGNILIMGISKLWMLRQNSVTKIELPAKHGISSFAYDKEQNGIYATNPVSGGGLYYLDLSAINATP